MKKFVAILMFITLLSMSFFISCENKEETRNTPVIEQMLINDDGELVIVFEDGTETNVGKVVGKDGEKGDKGDEGDSGAKGADAVQPKFRVNEDGYWEVSSDNGATWSSLGVRATGDKGDEGEESEDRSDSEVGSDGSDGVGIVSVVKTGTEGVVDTYTITFTDNTTATFTVTNDAGDEVPTEVIVKVWVDDDDVLWVRYYDASKVVEDPEHATRDVSYEKIHSNNKVVSSIYFDQNGVCIITYTDGTWEIVHKLENKNDLRD